MSLPIDPQPRRAAVAAVLLAAVALPFGTITAASAAPPDWQSFETQNGTATLSLPADMSVVDESEPYVDYNATDRPTRWMNILSIVDASGSEVLSYSDHTLFDGTVSEPATMGLVDSVVLDDTLTAAAWWFQPEEGGPVTSKVSLVPTDMPSYIQDDRFVFTGEGGVSLQSAEIEHATQEEAIAHLEGDEAQSLLAIIAEYRLHGGIGTMPDGADPGAWVTLLADVINDDGGTLTPEDVWLTLQDAEQTTVLEGPSFVGDLVPSGMYSLTHEPPAGYDVTWSCDTELTSPDGGDPTFEVQPEHDVTCTATFDDQAVLDMPILDLAIEVVTDDGGTLAEEDVVVDLAYEDALAGTWDVIAATEGQWSFPAGSVELGVLDPSIEGYRETWSCAGIDGTPDPSPTTGEESITFATEHGEHYACTVTLDDIRGLALPEAQIGIEVQITNDDGGDVQPDAVSVYLEWSDPTDEWHGWFDAWHGERYTIAAGTTTLTMPEVDGYAMALACDGQDGVEGDGEVVADDIVTLLLAEGADVTCTLTLDDGAEQAASTPSTTGTLPETGASSTWWLTALAGVLLLAGSGTIWLRSRH